MTSGTGAGQPAGAARRAAACRFRPEEQTLTVHLPAADLDIPATRYDAVAADYQMVGAPTLSALAGVLRDAPSRPADAWTASGLRNMGASRLTLMLPDPLGGTGLILGLSDSSCLDLWPAACLQLFQAFSGGIPAREYDHSGRDGNRPRIRLRIQKIWDATEAAAGIEERLRRIGATGIGWPLGWSIYALPAPVPSGTGLRTGRLLHEAGAKLDCAAGLSGRRTRTGQSAGITWWDGEWVQAVRWPDDLVEAVHPALVTPYGINPYEDLAPEDAARTRAFDAAEAARLPAAQLPARLLKPGDIVYDEHELTVESVTPSTDRIHAACSGPDGTAARSYPAGQHVTVAHPFSHPAGNGPHANLLFTAVGTDPAFWDLSFAYPAPPGPRPPGSAAGPGGAAIQVTGVEPGCGPEVLETRGTWHYSVRAGVWRGGPDDSYDIYPPGKHGNSIIRAYQGGKWYPVGTVAITPFRRRASARPADRTPLNRPAGPGRESPGPALR